MNVLKIPSMSYLFDYNPTPTSAKYDSEEFIISDSAWPKLMQNLAKDLNLHISKEGKSVYRGQKRVATVITNINPMQGSAPMA